MPAGELIVEAQTLAVVVLGTFNPPIISPWWLQSQGLLGETEAEEAEDLVVVPQLSQFNLPWLKVQVLQDRFLMLSEDPLEWDRLRDTILGVFTVLRHTPVAAVGINVAYHYRLPSNAAWHELGDTLVPKEPWDGLSLPGLRSLTIEGARPDVWLGHVRVRVEPSEAVPNGLFVEHNDHYALEKFDHVVESRNDPHDLERLSALADLKPSPDRGEELMEVLGGQWTDSVNRAERVAQHVARMAGV